MIKRFDQLVAPKGYSWKVEHLLPKVLVAGEDAGVLTEAGAKLLDPTGTLEAGCPLCPPEGDAGTGMAATNSVKPRTGNVSAGTSVFAMIVLEKELQKVYEEIDMVTTPSGDAPECLGEYLPGICRELWDRSGYGQAVLYSVQQSTRRGQGLRRIIGI